MNVDNGSLVDLSHKLNSNIQAYPGDVAYTCRPTASVEKDSYSVHAISMSSHTGTHIDAPSHFFADGKTVDQIPLSDLIGPCLIVDLIHMNLKERQKIVWDDLAAYHGRMKEGVFLLLHTGWSEHWGMSKYYEHPFLDKDAALHILEKGIRVLAVDTLNPDETPYGGVGGAEGFEVHKIFLGAGGVIAENLTNLKALDGHDMISLVPLNLAGVDGSPVRAFAWRDNRKL